MKGRFERETFQVEVEVELLFVEIGAAVPVIRSARLVSSESTLVDRDDTVSRQARGSAKCIRL